MGCASSEPFVQGGQVLVDSAEANIDDMVKEVTNVGQAVVNGEYNCHCQQNTILVLNWLPGRADFTELKTKFSHLTLVDAVLNNFFKSSESRD